jgi:anti-anti-sigma factor
MGRTGLETADFTRLTGRGDTIRRVAGFDESEARFSLRGEFDISNKWQLFAALTPYVASQTFTIDLAHATFIDASTLGVFVHVARRRRELNATRLRIVKSSAHFRRIFSLCELDDVFKIEDEAASQGKRREPVYA